MTTVMRTPSASGDTSKPKRKRDRLLDGDNDGVRFLFDFAFSWCYPGGPKTNRPEPGVPENGAVVYDISEREDGIVRRAAGQVIDYAGGGFDYSPVTGRGNYLEIPASVAADIWNPVEGQSQFFLACHYIKFPDLASWTEMPPGNYNPIINWCGTDASPTAYYSTTPEIAFLSFKPDGQMQGHIQRDINVMSTLQTATGASYIHKDLLTQCAIWRSPVGLGFRIRSSAGTQLVTAALNAPNVADYSASKGKMGVSNAIWIASGMTNGGNFRSYRGFVENLARSGRNPQTVLDADYARVMARGAFS